MWKRWPRDCIPTAKELDGDWLRGSGKEGSIQGRDDRYFLHFGDDACRGFTAIVKRSDVAQLEGRTIRTQLWPVASMLSLPTA